MQAFVDACRGAPSFAQLTALLPQVVGNSAVHALFLNTLSRLEYVGVRKMLKVRQADCLDLAGLQHILEEAVHAIRLKKSAHSLQSANVTTYAAAHTLAGSQAESYFQQIDQACAQQLAKHATKTPTCPPQELAYLLTSTAIEVRAHCLYPAYQAALQQADSPISVASILNDEERHLQQMAELLPPHLPNWRSALAAILQTEEQAFAALVGAWKSAVAAQKGAA